ncbi:MAG: tyrosine-type recombinase/integrase [Synergistaceae bacterium]|nr:tyrosine-type recombinase/integrase [Synergistaceae bacterium]
MLTELKIKNLKPRAKKYLIRDERGLYLRVDPNGRKYFIFRFFENKKERQFSLGTYPEVSLKDARIKRDELQQRRGKGEHLISAKMVSGEQFGEIASEWLSVRMSDKSKAYLKGINLKLKNYIMPKLGHRPVKDIKTPEILHICREIEKRGFLETATRVKNIIGQIFRFAIAAGYCDIDPTVSLKGALKTIKHKHMAAIFEPEQIGLLMRSMRLYPYIITRAAMLFSIYTFCRPGEIRMAEWTEVDFDKKIWRIPAERMKARREHIVPLSRQALEILNELYGCTGSSKYIFPSIRSNKLPMSDGTVRIALRPLGFSKEVITPHGFKAMFSPIANEHGFNADVIERQLSHLDKNQVRAAYNRAKYLSDRVKIMQWWADYLDGLAEGE